MRSRAVLAKRDDSSICPRTFATRRMSILHMVRVSESRLCESASTRRGAEPSCPSQCFAFFALVPFEPN